MNKTPQSAEKQRIFRQLKAKITLFCTLLTGLVLAAVFVLAFRSARQELLRSNQELFDSRCQTVVAYLSSGNELDREKLLQFSQQNELFIKLVDAGHSFVFVPAGQQDFAQTLFEAAQQTPEGARLYLPQRTSQLTGFDFEFEDHAFSAALYSSQTGGARWFNLLMLQKDTDVSGQLLHLRRSYLVIFVFSLLALTAISALLARCAARPVEQAQQEQLRFLARASHELKSPLAVISTSADVLQRGLGDPREQLSVIQSQTGQMARLVDDLLVLTNSGTGRWTLRTSPVLPEDLLLDVYESFVGIMEQKGQRLRVELPEEPCAPIQADEQRLKQVLSILLDNAHCYSPQGSEVTLSLSQTARLIQFSVMDQGPGIPDSDKKKIFSYFYRTTTASPAKKEGTPGHYGMGLAVAAELAGLHHGRLTVTDTPGGGATFSLSLPKP